MPTVPDTTTEQGQREASVMLARLCGWHIGNKKTERGAWIRVLCDDHGNDLGLRPPFGGGVAPKHQELVPSGLFNLYAPANMALAWRVLNWVQANMDRGARRDLSYIVMDFTAPPAAAQRAWLDEVSKMATEAGLVAAANESQ